VRAVSDSETKPVEEEKGREGNGLNKKNDPSSLMKARIACACQRQGCGWHAVGVTQAGERA
jgi:hypothetical protein